MTHTVYWAVRDLYIKDKVAEGKKIGPVSETYTQLKEKKNAELIGMIQRALKSKEEAIRVQRDRTTKFQNLVDAWDNHEQKKKDQVIIMQPWRDALETAQQQLRSFFLFIYRLVLYFFLCIGIVLGRL
ncbi:hypothetical protein FACS189472_14470 [Alphaproteobacteria bacterium]|nr:hypothetical protein FACS189472_14470 [Alphaproteobacteria bacterium]